MENWKIRIKQVSALSKVFPDTEPVSDPETRRLTVLQNDIVSFQAAFAGDNPRIGEIRVRVDSPLGQLVHVRRVELVPVAYPHHVEWDDNYLRQAPGLFPDALAELPADGATRLVAGQWAALWVDVETRKDTPAGEYPVEVALTDSAGTVLGRVCARVQVVGVALPAQTLLHTEWFHADCLADYYHVPVFSQAHWAIVERFVRLAARRGMNTLLTPVFTPPLDTAPGGERTTVQLVDVRRQNGTYSFGFDRLRRWVEMCRGAGISHLEIAHLFTQWGAKAAPKIMAEADGEYRRIFGWDTPAVGGEYTRFLQAFLPELTARLREWGMAGQTFFHISDEPGEKDLPGYLAARDSVSGLLEGFPVVDALSHYEYYESGAVAHPVPSIDHIEPFLAHHVPNLWTYYCTSQWDRVTNRFIDMPSARCRILGVQLYQYQLAGFLHWGYNFYNTAFSRQHIDPWRITDAGGAFPAGDPFLVYPGADGCPVESIRMMVMQQAMHDMRALQLLETLRGRQAALSCIGQGLENGLTLTDYPKGEAYLIRLRNRVNLLCGKAAGVLA